MYVFTSYPHDLTFLNFWTTVFLFLFEQLNRTELEPELHEYWISQPCLLIIIYA